MKRIAVLLAVIMSVEAHAQLEDGFRFTSNDEWWAKDKRDHFIGGMGTTLITTVAVDIIRTEDFLTKKNVRNIAIFNAVMWLLWEVKDGAYSLNHYESPIGGDGFSYKDYLWSLAGIAVWTMINHIIYDLW